MWTVDGGHIWDIWSLIPHNSSGRAATGNQIYLSVTHFKPGNIYLSVTCHWHVFQIWIQWRHKGIQLRNSQTKDGWVIEDDWCPVKLGPKGTGREGPQGGQGRDGNPENWCKLAPIWKLLPTSEKRNRQLVGSPEASELRCQNICVVFAGEFFRKYWEIRIFKTTLRWPT